MSYDDQLIKIMQSLGPAKVDTSFVSESNDYTYIQKLQEGISEASDDSFDIKHKNLSKEEYDLVSSLLSFNPNKRKSIGELLDSPMFADIR